MKTKPENLQSNECSEIHLKPVSLLFIGQIGPFFGRFGEEKCVEVYTVSTPIASPHFVSFPHFFSRVWGPEKETIGSLDSIIAYNPLV